MSTTTVNVGLIGAGSIAQLHADSLDRGGAVIPAVCDVDPDKAAFLAERTGATPMGDVDELLARDDVDAVIVAVPNHLHSALAIKALAAKKDVLLEKPMAMNVGECDDVIEALRGTDRLLQLGFVTRGSATSVAAREIIESGRLGTIYHAKASMYRRRGIPGLGRWFTTRAESGGGALIDLGVHLLDLVMHLTGRRDPVRVSGTCHSGFGRPPSQYVFQDMWAGPPDPSGPFDVEDGATGLVRFDGGLTLELNVTWAANLPEAPYRDGVLLLGEKGGLFFDPWGEELTIAGETGGYLEDVRIKVHAGNPWAAAWDRQARSFISSVALRDPPAATAEHGRVVQSVLGAMYRSDAAGREVEVGGSLEA